MFTYKEGRKGRGGNCRSLTLETPRRNCHSRFIHEYAIYSRARSRLDCPLSLSLFFPVLSLFLSLSLFSSFPMQPPSFRRARHSTSSHFILSPSSFSCLTITFDTYVVSDLQYNVTKHVFCTCLLSLHFSIVFFVFVIFTLPCSSRFRFVSRKAFPIERMQFTFRALFFFFFF